MGIIVKRAEQDDVAALFELNIAYNKTSCSGIQDISRSLIENKNEYVLIAYVDGEPAGFLCGLYCRSMCYKTALGSVGELYVYEKYRRLGIARELIVEIENIFRGLGVSIVTIETSQQNTGAQALYMTCGYSGKQRVQYRKSLTTDGN